VSLWLTWAPKLLQGEGTNSPGRAISHLGEPVTSGVSISSPRGAAIAPSAHFPINRRAWEAEERFQGSVLEGI